VTSKSGFNQLKKLFLGQINKIMVSSKIYLNVPFTQKDDAKKLGAQWDSQNKSWYVPSDQHLDAFSKWLPITKQRETPYQLLTIELVPQTCWYSNVRSNISKQEWDKLRHYTYKQAGHRCKICGRVGRQHPVECHEIWHYDDSWHIQKLIGLVALCPSCHEVKHVGYANTQGRGDIAIAHLAYVNVWSITEAMEYVEQCFEIWQERSRYEWILDISYLEQFNITI